MERILTVLTTCLAVSGTACMVPVTTFDVGLKQVERPAQARERYGEQRISTDQFEDEMVQIVWSVMTDRIAFRLTNKTDHSVRVVWDEAAYVDTSGESHHVTHYGITYADRNNPQVPSVVVRKGTLTDAIIPTDNVEWAWNIRPLFPMRANTREEPAAQKVDAARYAGKHVQVLLPLAIQDVVNEYIFTFEVEEVSVAQKWQF